MKYNRILLKLSGEAIGGKDGVGLDENVMAAYAQQIAAVVKQGVQVAIVIGGGNIFRGLSGTQRGFDRVRGDQMGMLATVINSIGLSLSLRNAGLRAEVFTSTPMRPMPCSSPSCMPRAPRLRHRSRTCPGRCSPDSPSDRP